FAHLPVNRPLADVRTHQQDGFGRHDIPHGQAFYTKNTIGGGCPALADEDVFRHYTRREEGDALRIRAESFKEYYRQPRMFWRSMTATEAEHIVSAFAFELGKCKRVEIRSHALEQLVRIDPDLASRVAGQLGLPTPDAGPVEDVPLSPALSQVKDPPATIATRKIAVLAADGVDVAGVERLRTALRDRGAETEVLAEHGGELSGANGALTVDKTLATMASVLYDAVVVAGGDTSARTLAAAGPAVHFVTE